MSFPHVGYIMLLSFVMILSIAGAAVVFISYVVAWRITRPGVHTYWDEYTFLPSDMGAPFETVRFTTCDGLRLAGWLMAHAQSPADGGHGKRLPRSQDQPAAHCRRGCGSRVSTSFCSTSVTRATARWTMPQTMGWREQRDLASGAGRDGTAYSGRQDRTARLVNGRCCEHSRRSGRSACCCYCIR